MTKTLSEFIENYIKNLGISGAPQPFEDYKASLDNDYDGSFTKAVRSALTKKRQSASDYGAVGEELSDMGLSNSGYQSYLSRLASDKYKSTLSSLEEKRNIAQGQALSGYADYLRQFAKNEGSLRNSVKEHLLDRNVIDFNTAYEYAINAGLSDSDARSISNSVYAINRQKVIKQILDQVLTLRLDENSVKLYAKAIGLNDDDTDYVISASKGLFEHFDTSSKEYQDLIDRLENNANKK